MIGKNIFITGATGFIGENLALKLAGENRVFALVRPESVKKTTKLKEKGVQIITGDILNSDSYSEKLNSIDYVFHLAALCKLDAPQELFYRYNVLGARRLLETCIGKNIKRIIHFSTAYVSGRNEGDFIKEDEPYPKRFKNWYEWSKAEGEKIALDFSRRYNLPTVIIRPAIVYGPGSFWGLYEALSLINNGKLWLLPGNGENKIHLVYVDEVVEAAIHLAEREGSGGEIYHVCDDDAFTCKELVKIVCKELNKKPPVGYLPCFLVKTLIRIPFCRSFFAGIKPQLLDYFIYNQTFSNEKLKSINYLLRHGSLENNLKITINWYHKNGFLN